MSEALTKAVQDMIDAKIAEALPPLVEEEVRRQIGNLTNHGLVKQLTVEMQDGSTTVLARPTTDDPAAEQQLRGSWPLSETS